MVTRASGDRTSGIPSTFVKEQPKKQGKKNKKWTSEQLWQIHAPLFLNYTLRASFSPPKQSHINNLLGKSCFYSHSSIHTNLKCQWKSKADCVLCPVNICKHRSIYLTPTKHFPPSSNRQEANKRRCRVVTPLLSATCPGDVFGSENLSLGTTVLF